MHELDGLRESLKTLIIEYMINVEEVILDYGHGLVEPNGELWVQTFVEELGEALRVGRSSDGRLPPPEHALTETRACLIKLGGNELREEALKVLCLAE